MAGAFSSLLRARAERPVRSISKCPPVDCGPEWWNTYAFSSYHPGGANFAMTDGSVRFIQDSIALQTYRNLATRQAGEVANAP